MLAFSASKSKTSVIDKEAGIAAVNIFSTDPVFNMKGLLPKVKILFGRALTNPDVVGAEEEGP